MKLLKLFSGRFSLVLMMAMVFTALTTSASAQTVVSQNGIRDGNHPGGINVIFSDGSVRFVVKVLEVLLMNSPLKFDRVDAEDSNAASKVRMLFDAAKRMGSAVVLTVPKKSVKDSAKFKTARLIVSDDNKSRMEIKMQDVLVSSYSYSSAKTNDSISVKFERVNYR